MFINFKNFKEKLTNVLDRYSELREQAKDKIIEQAQEKLEGYEKKAIVDAFIIKELEVLKKAYPNVILVFIIDLLISRVPDMTQKIYDKLKAKIKGITTR